MDSSERALSPPTEDGQTNEALTPAAEKALLLEIKQAFLVYRSFSGPMPAPEHLRQYDQIIPGAGREILDEFKANGNHQRTIELKALQTAGDRDHRAQWMAFSLVVLGFLLILVLAYLNHDGVAGVVAVSLVGAVAANFLQHKKVDPSLPPKKPESSDQSDQG